MRHNNYGGSGRIRLMPLVALTATLLTLIGVSASLAGASNGGSSVNNGGGTPSCGNSCDSSGNPSDFHKPCDPVPGNGCHVLPDTPCERGHGNTESKNKHCRPEDIAQVFLGYADTYRPQGLGLPSPWSGGTNVVFVGCGTNASGGKVTDACPKEPTGGGDSYDSGAIRIDNVSTTDSLPVSAASVTVGPCTYNPWPGLNVTIPPGGTLILTQTGGTDPCGSTLSGQYNFDVSESFQKSTQYQSNQCSNDGFIPVVTLTLNTTITTIHDTGQILNTGGVDSGGAPCGLANEFHDWVAVL